MIYFKKLNEDAQVPTMGSLEAAGLDLFTTENAVIPAGKRALLKTGIAMSIPKGFVGLIWPRSKLAAKKGIDVLAGVVDSDYRGEIMVSLLNTSDEPVEIKAGDKCAQMIVQQHFSDMHINVMDELPKSERGSEGVNSHEMRY